jgi:transposase-like protein
MAERTIPAVSSLLPVLFDEQKCIEFLFAEGILLIPELCYACGGRVNRNGQIFRCTRNSCRKATSIFRSSFFSKSRLRCCEVLHLGYLWLTGCSRQIILHNVTHSKDTISAYLVWLRELVSQMLEPDDTMIGGANVIVEVDETKFGKRKYHRGHRVDGAWVIVGVERTVDRLVFAEVVPDRSAATIDGVLSRHILDGSILYTDLWRGYASISERFNIEHRTVNHSKGFKDPVTGVHTNTVEGTNYALKRSVPPRSRTSSSLPLHLIEFVWRRKHSANLWLGFIEALRSVEYDVSDN